MGIYIDGYIFMNRGCLYKTKNIRFSWNGLWLLIMLLYSDVVHTSVSILNCPMLTGYDGKRSLVLYMHSHLHN